MPTATPSWQPAFPIRAAFYYPWFPEAWNQLGINPYTNYHPTAGFYSTTSVIGSQITAMRYAGLTAGIASWWGQGSKTDGRMAALLTAASGVHFRWAIYYEQESTGDPTAAQISADLTYIRDNYASSPGYLKVNGRFVVFVYSTGTDGCGMADRWAQGNTVDAYVVSEGVRQLQDCASQPDAWHQYGPAAATDSQPGYSYTISPGFWKAGTTPRRASRPRPDSLDREHCLDDRLQRAVAAGHDLQRMGRGHIRGKRGRVVEPVGLRDIYRRPACCARRTLTDRISAQPTPHSTGPKMCCTRTTRIGTRDGQDGIECVHP